MGQRHYVHPHGQKRLETFRCLQLGKTMAGRSPCPPEVPALEIRRAVKCAHEHGLPVIVRKTLHATPKALTDSKTQLGLLYARPHTRTQTRILNQTWAAASLVNPHKSDCAIVALWYLQFEAGDEIDGASGRMTNEVQS